MRWWWPSPPGSIAKWPCRSSSAAFPSWSKNRCRDRSRTPMRCWRRRRPAVRRSRSGTPSATIRRWRSRCGWSRPAAAQAGGATLAVGHTERHNPAVAIAMRLVTAPRFIEVHRLSAFPDRSLDIDVVFDLMIHDLDIILTLVHDDVVSMDAVGVPVLTPKYDIANVRLRFGSGC